MDWFLLTSETGLTVLLFIIGLIIVIYAQVKISTTYGKEKKVLLKSRKSGSEVARLILDKNNLEDIHVIEVKGELTDHYDPKRKVIRLSSDIFHGETIAAASVAAHEVGHALQDKDGYTLMRVRSAIVPVVNFITYIGYFVSVIALLAGITNYILIGIIIILATLLFQLVTLPVEYDASKRAKENLETLSIVKENEIENVDNMLSAAALTYVASFINSIMQLLRLILMYNNRKD